MKQRNSILTGLGVLAVMLLLVVFCPVGLSMGETRIDKSVSPVDSASPFPQGFAHGVWDGPTGSMSSGDCYTFRMGGWLWRLDIYQPGIDLKDLP